MNRIKISSRVESAAGNNVESDENVVISSGGCCCSGSPQKVNIERSKIMNNMNNVNESNNTTTVTAPEIVCGGCASSIKKALGNVEGVSDVDVDVATKKVTVKHEENVGREIIVDALDRAGYSVAS